jgi:uncharacterized membrane protein YcgQ (UPF0703/DUF1980 family)
MNMSRSPDNVCLPIDNDFVRIKGDIAPGYISMSHSMDQMGFPIESQVISEDNNLVLRRLFLGRTGLICCIAIDGKQKNSRKKAH